jgi:hypothetical protein
MTSEVIVTSKTGAKLGISEKIEKNKKQKFLKTPAFYLLAKGAMIICRGFRLKQ